MQIINDLNESLPDFPYSGVFAGIAAIVSLMTEQVAFEQMKKIMKFKDQKSPKENERLHLHIDNMNKQENGDNREVNENYIKPCNDCKDVGFTNLEEYTQNKLNSKIFLNYFF